MSHHVALTRRSAEEQQTLEAALRNLYEHELRFDELLGIKVESFDPAGPRFYLDMKPELIGHYASGRLHGGAIATVLDTVGGFATAMGIVEKYCDESTEQILHRLGRISTIDLRIDYLRQGIGKRFHAQGTVIRLGGRIASTQMTLHNQEGVLIATGAAAYIVS